ncbi:DUF6064 family protein [Filomicrobium sp.]|uniref:DUF6064 family protein n=1 Tax=Filomicrobium sp. TaxID=2024831 RepID=UPI002585BC4E|nr:DUF6064 family protein [Filomicrobium sp.]MCV0370184.1 DUF6064 family protein [Filomicrobium sp.]
MADWSSYSLSDFLLFSPQVYERLFVLLNRDMWPWQLAALVGSVAVLVLTLRGTQSGSRAAFAILGAAWISVASVFFLGRYETINWLGAYFAPVAGLEGAMLILLSFAGRVGLVDPRKNRLAFSIGLAVLVCGLFLYPLFEAAFGLSFEGAQVFGLTPDPTAVATLGGVALLSGRLRFLAAVIPAAWCIFTALTLWTLERADFFLAPGLLIIALMAIFLPRSTDQSQ